MKTLRAAIALCLFCLPLAAAHGQQAPLPTNPHGPLRSGMDCADCHTSAGWRTMRPDAKFDHAKETRFALSGRHVTVGCARCHLKLRFDEPKAELGQCSSCHADVHRGNLAGACIRCHNTNDFRDVEAVTLHQRTRFPLSGAHVMAPCESCHRTEKSGAYTAVARECLACHRKSLATAATSGVDHAGFPSDCAACHVTLSWTGGTVFDHATVGRGFTLDGAHALQRCTACHTTPGFGLRFAPPPTGTGDCVACHRADYTRVHSSNGYPTSCTDCHSVNTWSSSFNHDGQYFPISSGAHRGKWQNCATCHTTPGDFKTFTCISCHKQPDMDSKHSGRSGYSYDSESCYRCHPRGKN